MHTYTVINASKLYHGLLNIRKYLLSDILVLLQLDCTFLIQRMSCFQLLHALRSQLNALPRRYSCGKHWSRYRCRFSCRRDGMSGHVCIFAPRFCSLSSSEKGLLGAVSRELCLRKLIKCAHTLYCSGVYVSLRRFSRLSTISSISSNFCAWSCTLSCLL